MKKNILLIFSALCFFLLMGTFVVPSAATQTTISDVGDSDDTVTPRPLVTVKCLDKSESGNCKLKQTTHGYNGVECVENCVKLDSWGACKVQNTCRFDAASKCFSKNVCVELDSFGGCKTWQEDAVCK